jgi:TolB-like protein
MRIKRGVLGLWWILGLLLPAILSCASTRDFAQGDVDWGFYTTLGVAPFQSVANDRLAGAKVTSAFVTELLMTRTFQVTEPGSFARAMTEVMKAQNNNDPTQLSANDLKLIGEKAGVQGILLGTVREYEMVRVGQEEYPLVSIDLRLVDAPTGNLLWTASLTRRGGPNLPFLSIGETHTLGQMTEKVCRDLAGSLADKAK